MVTNTVEHICPDQAEAGAAQVVAAILVPAELADDLAPGHTWKWRCACGAASFATFATAEQADRYGRSHMKQQHQ